MGSVVVHAAHGKSTKTKWARAGTRRERVGVDDTREGDRFCVCGPVEIKAILAAAALHVPRRCGGDLEWLEAGCEA